MPCRFSKTSCISSIGIVSFSGSLWPPMIFSSRPGVPMYVRNCSMKSPSRKPKDATSASLRPRVLCGARNLQISQSACVRNKVVKFMTLCESPHRHPEWQQQGFFVMTSDVVRAVHRRHRRWHQYDRKRWRKHASPLMLYCSTSLMKLVILDTKSEERSGLRNTIHTTNEFGDEIGQVITAITLQWRSPHCASQCECKEVQCILRR